MHQNLLTTLLVLLAATFATRTGALALPSFSLFPRNLGDKVNPSAVSCHPENGIIPKDVVQSINQELDNMGAVDNDKPCCPSDQGVRVKCASASAQNGTVYDLSVVAEAPGMGGNKKYCIGSAELANYVADFESGLPNGGCLTPDGNGVDTVWQAVWQDDGLNVVLAVHS